MPILAKAGDFQISPEGQYPAICQTIIDLGTQHNATYNNWQPKVIIGWELHGENQMGDGSAYMRDGKPFIHKEWFTCSLTPKSNLTSFLQSWRGKNFTPEELKGFDVAKLIGAPCMLTIVHNTADNGKTYANVSAITPLLKIIERPKMANPPIVFTLDPWEPAKFDLLPEFYKEKVKSSKEYQAMVSGPKPEEESQEVPFNDEIPF